MLSIDYFVLGCCCFLMTEPVQSSEPAFLPCGGCVWDWYRGMLNGIPPEVTLRLEGRRHPSTD